MVWVKVDGVQKSEIIVMLKVKIVTEIMIQCNLNKF